MLSQTTEYGLSGDYMLKVGNDYPFLVQAELKSIKQGLQYKEIKYKGGGSYKGYLN
jgi:hypothetical protein